MYRNLLRVPLQQTLVLLWLVGIVQLLLRLEEHHLTFGWAFSAGLGALVAALLAAHFRALQLLPISTPLGLGALLTILYQLDLNDSAGLAFASALYALLLWGLVVYTLSRPATLHLVEILRLRGGYGEAGGRALAEQTTHWSAFAIIVACAVLLVTQSPFLVLGSQPLTDNRALWPVNGGPSLIALPALATGGVFLLLAGQRYRLILHSYVLLVLVVFAALLLYAWTVPSATLPNLLADPQLGLLLVLLSLSLWTLAWILDHRASDPEDRVEFAQSLYRKPLRVTAVVLALSNAILQLGQVGLDSTYGIPPLAVVVLWLSSLSLLLANHALRHRPLDLIAILLAVLALLWTESWLTHGGTRFSLWPGGHTLGDLWLTLGLAAFGLASAARYLNRSPRWTSLYAEPLNISALLCYAWTLLGTVTLILEVRFNRDAYLSWTLLALVATLLSLQWPLSAAAQSRVRGLGMALLLSAWLFTLLAVHGQDQWLRFGALLWAYCLWGLAAFVLPRFNARWPAYAIAPEVWPWLGLALVVIALLEGAAEAFQWGGLLLATAIYSLLMLRNSSWAGFPWLAVAALTSAGIAVVSACIEYLLPSADQGVFLRAFAAGNLVWANVLLGAVSLWRRYGEAISVSLGWRSHDLSAPFELCSVVILSLWLVGLISLETHAIFSGLPTPPIAYWPSILALAILLSLSFFHALWLRKALLQAHTLLICLFCTTLAAYFALAATLFHPPLLLMLWSAALLAVYRLVERSGWRKEHYLILHQALAQWLQYSLIFAIVALLLYPQVPLPERLLTLTALTGLAATLGLWQRQRGWLLTAAVMLLVLLHAWPLWWVTLPQLGLLLPWYALQLVILAWILVWHEGSLQEYLDRQLPSRVITHQDMRQELARLVFRSWPWLIALAIVEWTLHELIFIARLAASAEPQWLAGSWDAAAFLLTGLLLLGWSIRYLRHDPNSPWAYGMVTLAGAIGVYVRLLLFGIAPVTVWDTAALIMAAYALFIVQRSTLSKPLLNLAMLMPLLALSTVPMQLASIQASGALLASGILYLLLRRETGRLLPLYLGLLAFNLCLYLWVPSWASQTQLLQVYIMPAALSVLILLQLHHRELKPSVSQSTRLGATATLYASATLDVFLRPALGIFALALLLSLVGVVLGIALRVRAFLYTGVSFLVLNVLGQLLRFYPEQRLSKAIMLMVLGAAITGTMIWFNMKREAILQRIRIFRADLETWE